MLVDGTPLEDQSSILPSEAQIRHEIEFINSMLIKLGMDCPLAILKASVEGEKVDEISAEKRWELGQACSVMIPLLTAKIREQAFRTDVEDRVKRLAEDLHDKSTQLTKQQARAEELERANLALSEELKSANVRCKQLEIAHVKSKEENSRLRTAFQLKEKQFIHELRKREHEFDRLKEQLQSHFNKEILSGASVERAEMARLSVAPESYHRLSIYGEPMLPSAEDEESMVDRLTGLEGENESMRSLLISINQLLQELKAVLELDDHQVDEAGNPITPTSPSALEVAISGIPIDWVYEDIKAEIERSLALLSHRVADICGIPL